MVSLQPIMNGLLVICAPFPNLGGGAEPDSPAGSLLHFLTRKMEIIKAPAPQRVEVRIQ